VIVNVILGHVLSTSLWYTLNIIYPLKDTANTTSFKMYAINLTKLHGVNPGDHNPLTKLTGSRFCITVTMMSTISYDMTPYSLMKTYRRFGGTYSPHPQGWKVNQATSKNQGLLVRLALQLWRWSGAFLRNVCKLLPDYPASITKTLLHFYVWVSCKKKI
jgi:hypothetical protein